MSLDVWGILSELAHGNKVLPRDCNRSALEALARARIITAKPLRVSLSKHAQTLVTVTRQQTVSRQRLAGKFSGKVRS